MNIEVSDYTGACKRCEKALNLVYEIYEREQNSEHPKNICLYKDIIDNPKVHQEFQELGIIFLDNIADACSNDIVILGLFGSNKKVIDYLEANNIEYYDPVCDKFKAIYTNILEYYQKGYEIVIVGNKESAEVKVLNSYCEDQGLIITKEEDLENISETKKKYVVIENSLHKKEYNTLIEKIKNKYSNLEIIVEDNICPIFKKVSDNARVISLGKDYVFIIGSKTSFTNMELKNNIEGAKNVLIMANPLEFYHFLLKNDKVQNIALIGGIETPIKEIMDFYYLSNFIIFYKECFKKMQTSQDEVNTKLLDLQDNPLVQNVVKDIIALNSDGKYIRATLIGLGYYLGSGAKDDSYLDLAYAYELFQTAVLIHDDIIDNAKLRRGKETIPRRICEKYLNLKKNDRYYHDTVKLANSIGICAGDLGFYEANKIIIKNYKNHANLERILELYNDIIIKTIKGEIIDVYLPFQSKYNFQEVAEKDIFDIYELKTSWYTIIGPFILGYALASQEVTDSLLNILKKIGIAFQLKDDFLGIYASSDVIGKPNTSDISEYKQTLLYSYIMKTKYRKEFLKYYGKDKISSTDLAMVRSLLYKSGAYHHVLDYLDELYLECSNEISELDLSEEGKNILKGLIIYISIREK